MGNTMTETVEEFLKRGGEIKKIDPGETSGKIPNWHTVGGDWLKIKDRITAQYWEKKKVR